MINKKGMSAWIWILIIIIVLAVGGFVAWLLLSGNSGSILGGGSSGIPQPPALPTG